MTTIESVLSQRKYEFENFLELFVPENKREWLNELKKRNITEFILFFKQFIIGKNIDSVIETLLNKVDMKKEDIEPKYIDGFKQYLELFSEFINEL